MIKKDLTKSTPSLIIYFDSSKITRKCFANVKKIYIIGRIVRISFLITSAFLIYAFVDMYIQSDFKFANLMFLFFIAIVIVLGIAYIYSMGLFFDKKNDIVRIVTGFSNDNKRERVLSSIDSIDLELNGNIGMSFIIKYSYNYTEKIEYKFYRISFIEKAQYKRIKKQLTQINQQ